MREDRVRRTVLKAMNPDFGRIKSVFFEVPMKQRMR
jgi:hypothetical protein